jgi:hypothetical protein
LKAWLEQGFDIDTSLQGLDIHHFSLLLDDLLLCNSEAQQTRTVSQHPFLDYTHPNTCQVFDRRLAFLSLPSSQSAIKPIPG